MGCRVGGVGAGVGTGVGGAGVGTGVGDGFGVGDAVPYTGSYASPLFEMHIMIVPWKVPPLLHTGIVPAPITPCHNGAQNNTANQSKAPL